MLKRVKGGLLSILSTNRGQVSNRRHLSRRLFFSLSLRVHHYEQRQSITEWFDHRMDPRVGGEPLERVPYLEIHAGKPLERNSLSQLPYRNFPVSLATSQSELWRSDTRQLGHCFRPRLGLFRRCYEHIQEHHRGRKRRRNFPRGNSGSVRSGQPGSLGILAHSEGPLRFSSLSFGGALLVGLAIASIRVTVGLEAVENIFDHVNEAESAAKFSHREMEIFLLFRVCLHKQQRSNQLLRSRRVSMFRPSLSSGALPC